MPSPSRFSLATLFCMVTGVAVVLGLAPRPMVGFYALLGFFFVATLLARFGPTPSRRFWFWFAICGWLYVLLSIPLLESVESSAGWALCRGWLEASGIGGEAWSPRHYLMVVHFITSAAIALIGAVLAQVFYQKSPKTT